MKNTKVNSTRPIMSGDRIPVRPRFGILLVLAICSLVSPSLAGDFVNTKRFEQVSLYSLGATRSLQALPAVRGIPRDIAFAMPRPIPYSTEQTSQPAPQPAPEKREISRGKKWGGIVLMIYGSLQILGGALVQDPCSGISGAVSCTSNYKTVRTASFVIGGTAFVSGAVLYSKRFK